MKPNEILDEIYRTRDEIMRECDYDLDRLFAVVKRSEDQAAAQGGKLVSFENQRRENAAGSIIREEPEK